MGEDDPAEFVEYLDDDDERHGLTDDELTAAYQRALAVRRDQQRSWGAVRSNLTLAFDELNCPDFPGETLALKEVFGLSRYAIKRFPMINPGMPSYLVIE